MENKFKKPYIVLLISAIITVPLIILYAVKGSPAGFVKGGDNIITRVITIFININYVGAAIFSKDYRWESICALIFCLISSLLLIVFGTSAGFLAILNWVRLILGVVGSSIIISLYNKAKKTKQEPQEIEENCVQEKEESSIEE